MENISLYVFMIAQRILQCVDTAVILCRYGHRAPVCKWKAKSYLVFKTGQ